MQVCRRLAIPLCMTAFAATGACAEPWEDILAKIYPAAKAEGEVIFNTERQEEVGGKDGLAQFQKRFPGIKISFNGVAGAALPARIMLEAKSGKVSVDAFRSDPSRAELLADKDLLVRIEPGEITDQPVKTFFDNRFFKLSDHITNFAYNTDAVKPANRPKTYEDLLDPKWQRRIVMDARGGELGHLLSTGAFAEDRFWKLINGLKDQKPIWTTRNTEAMVKLTSGEGLIGTGSYAAIDELKKKGAPVEFLFLSPALAQVRAAAIIKGAAHPNAAKLLIGWLLSPEGLKARDAHGVSPIVSGTTVFRDVEAAGAKIVFEDTIEQINARDAAAKKVTELWGVLKDTD